MSKMDALRAMREARYGEATAAPGGSPAQETPRCGHRAISGRTCTREQGHPAKSHRYT